MDWCKVYFKGSALLPIYYELINFTRLAERYKWVNTIPEQVFVFLCKYFFNQILVMDLVGSDTSTLSLHCIKTYEQRNAKKIWNGKKMAQEFAWPGFFNPNYGLYGEEWAG